MNNISQLRSREGKRYLDFLHASQRLIESGHEALFSTFRRLLQDVHVCGG